MRTLSSMSLNRSMRRLRGFTVAGQLLRQRGNVCTKEEPNAHCCPQGRQTACAFPALNRAGGHVEEACHLARVEKIESTSDTHGSIIHEHVLQLIVLKAGIYCT